MGIRPSGLFVPKFGALFTAAENTNPLAVIASFTLAGGPVGWTHWGHLSRSEMPDVTTNSGKLTDITGYGGRRAAVVPAPAAADSSTYTLMQVDADTVGALAAVNGSHLAALELWVSGSRRYAVWYPHVHATAKSRPQAASPSEHASQGMTLTTLPVRGLNLAALADVASGIAPWPHPSRPDSLYIDDSAFPV